MTAGRKTKLTPQLQAHLLEMITKGVPVTTACRVVGINFQTYRNWVQRGEEEQARRDSDMTAAQRREQEQPTAASEKPYLEFVDQLEVADANGEARIIQAIEAAGENSWQAFAWLAQRRWPKHWGQTQHTTVSGPNGGPVALRAVSDAELDRLALEASQAVSFPGIEAAPEDADS